MRRPLAALAALLVIGIGAGTSLAAGSLDELLTRYRSVSGRRDDVAYEVQREALEQIADLGTEAAKRALKGLYGEEKNVDARRVVLVLTALVRNGGPAEVDFAIKAAEEARESLVLASLSRILAAAKREAARAYLRGDAILKATPPVKAQMARAFGASGDKEAAIALLMILREDDILVRTEALLALGQLKEEAAWDNVAAFLSMPDARLREVAARALGMMGTPQAIPHLVRALGDPAPLVVESAAAGLGLLESPAAIGPLVERLASEKGENLRIVDAVVRALERVTGMSLGDDPELWRSWWNEARQRPDGGAAKPAAPTTVSGPRYYGFSVRSRRVTFVLDVSRSMGWNGRLERAQKELVQVLAGLSARTKFDLITYSDFAQAWGGKLAPALPDTVKRATRFVERLEPVNGTNIYDALRKAFSDEEVDTIFFLSDGTPTVGPVVDPEQILADVREMNRWRRVRIHTIALVLGDPPGGFGVAEDPAAASSFMKRLASENDGDFREVR